MIGLKVKVNQNGFNSWPHLTKPREKYGDLVGIIKDNQLYNMYYTIDFGDFLPNESPFHDCHGFFNSRRGYFLKQEQFDIISAFKQELDDLL